MCFERSGLPCASPWAEAEIVKHQVEEEKKKEKEGAGGGRKEETSIRSSLPGADFVLRVYIEIGPAR